LALSRPALRCAAPYQIASFNDSNNQINHFMNNPFNARTLPFDAAAINETIQRALASAGLDTSSGPMREVTQTIQRALSAGGVPQAAQRTDDVQVIDVAARTVATAQDEQSASDRESPMGEKQPPGSFEKYEFSNHAGARAYKLYLPTAVANAPRPMLVMLHGCTQSADDFAAGTQMNRLADEHGFIVVYPEQATHANASKCWNWFKPQDQQRDAGEPALIAGIVREVARKHGADPRRIFVAGLSAGAAMAVVLGQTYPELFAGVGAHSGLPFAAAHDIPSALAAMKGGRSGIPNLQPTPVAAATPRKSATQAVPLIVFHGDRDHTVHQKNGAQIVQQAEDAFVAQAGGAELRVNVQEGVAPGGRRFRRAVHTNAAGQTCIEAWTLHGAGHAWSGGHPSGSYTERAGPDASAEMLRFFLALPFAG
jgi:poly(hydroxyalkanoate) depolymerase family esterase